MLFENIDRHFRCHQCRKVTGKFIALFAHVRSKLISARTLNRRKSTNNVLLDFLDFHMSASE